MKEEKQIKQNAHTSADLKQMQSLPLEQKIVMTKQRLKIWYESWHKFEIYNTKTKKYKYVTIDARGGKEPRLYQNQYIDKEYDGQIYIAFSGGKDSTVLLDIARQMYPEIEAVYVDTGLEYPEVKQFVKSFDNVTIIRPEMAFNEVIKTYGYPIISKEISRKIWYQKNNNSEWAKKFFDKTYISQYNLSKYKPLTEDSFNIKTSDYCCFNMKKKPAHKYSTNSHKKAVTATMAAESRLRKQAWIRTGCNAFEKDHPTSNPMSFWTEQDVLEYIHKYNLPIASVYGKVVKDENGKYKTTGCNRTGCIFCAYGCHLEKGESRFQRLKRTHPKLYNYCIGGGELVDGIWMPNQKGLGMKYVFDKLNEIYGEDFIKY